MDLMSKMLFQSILGPEVFVAFTTTKMGRVDCNLVLVQSLVIFKELLAILTEAVPLRPLMLLKEFLLLESSIAVRANKAVDRSIVLFQDLIALEHAITSLTIAVAYCPLMLPKGLLVNESFETAWAIPFVSFDMPGKIVAVTKELVAFSAIIVTCNLLVLVKAVLTTEYLATTTASKAGVGGTFVFIKGLRV